MNDLQQRFDGCFRLLVSCEETQNMRGFSRPAYWRQYIRVNALGIGIARQQLKAVRLCTNLFVQFVQSLRLHVIPVLF